MSNVVLLGEYDTELLCRHGIRSNLKKQKELFGLLCKANKEDESYEKLLDELVKMSEADVFNFLNRDSGDPKYSIAKMIKLFDTIICIRAPRKNDRQIVQFGEFLMFGDNAIGDSIQNKPLDLTKIIVPASKKPYILEQLHSLGISQSTLFPELPNLCDRVKLKYVNRKGLS